MSTPSNSKQSPGRQARTPTGNISGTMATTHLPPLVPPLNTHPNPYQIPSQAYSHGQNHMSQGSPQSYHPINTMNFSSTLDQHVRAQQAMSFDNILHPASSLPPRDRSQKSPNTPKNPHSLDFRDNQQARSAYPYDPARSHSPSAIMVKMNPSEISTVHRTATPTVRLGAGIDPARFRLTIRQQPIAARACGHGERDRRVIDPPPILSLSLDGFNPDSPEDVSALTQPLNIVQCLLYSVPDGNDVTTVNDPNNPAKTTRRLMGTLVANPFIGTDPEAPGNAPENSRIGVFFIFHDVSCRQSGKYSLHFKLSCIAPAMGELRAEVPILATADSEAFDVLSAKEFPGMKASSALAIALKHQGATINVKKGAEAMAAAKRSKKRHSGSDRSASEDSK